MIQVKCECGRVLRTKDQNAGKHVNCPDCGEELRLPVPRSMRRQPSEPTLPARRGGRTTPPKKGDEETSARTPEGTDGPDKTMRYLLIMAGVVGAGVLTVVIVLIVKSTGPNTSTVGLPKNFIPFVFEAGEFACDQPEGWDPMYGGGTGNKPPFAKFTDDDNDITIEIRAAVSGSVVSDMLNQPAVDGEPPDPLQTVEIVHLLRKTQLSGPGGEYEEEDPELVETKGFGPSLMSSYAKSTILQSDYGYRATVIAHNYQYNVTLYCSERDMKRYKPTFVRVLSSMAPPGVDDAANPGK